MANLYLIRDLCEQRNITLRDLANRIGRNESSLQSAMRRGSTNSATIELIAKELNVPVGYFYEGTGYNSNDTDLLKEIKYLKEIITEKERIIEILLSDRKKMTCGVQSQM